MMKTPPPCVVSMGCLCCGHARGAPASVGCNASEDAPYYTRRGKLRRRQPPATPRATFVALARGFVRDMDRDLAHITGTGYLEPLPARPSIVGGHHRARATGTTTIVDPLEIPRVFDGLVARPRRRGVRR